MKAQIFNDGNKRSSIIFANHLPISHGEGLMTVPYDKVEDFRKLLVAYYEGKGTNKIKSFLKDYCWLKF